MGCSVASFLLWCVSKDPKIETWRCYQPVEPQRNLGCLVIKGIILPGIGTNVANCGTSSWPTQYDETGAEILNLQTRSLTFDIVHFLVYIVLEAATFYKCFPKRPSRDLTWCPRLLGASELQSKSGRSGGGISAICFCPVFLAHPQTSRK